MPLLLHYRITKFSSVTNHIHTSKHWQIMSLRQIELFFVFCFLAVPAHWVPFIEQHENENKVPRAASSPSLHRASVCIWSRSAAGRKNECGLDVSVRDYTDRRDSRLIVRAIKKKKRPRRLLEMYENSQRVDQSAQWFVAGELSVPVQSSPVMIVGEGSGLEDLKRVWAS